MRPEVLWLTATIVMTATLWIPYILNRLYEHSPIPALMNPEPDLRPDARWTERLMRAHANAVENLVVFAPLVGLVLAAGKASPLTALACMVYFWTRLAHALLYTAGIPLLRTIAFFIGFLCQMALAATVLGYA